MTDADRTDKAEERENMYIMMFTLQSLQNYGLSVKKNCREKSGLFVGMVSGVRGRKVSSVGKAAYAGVCKYGICT
ncbi:hypothetical protein M5E86_23325 [Blautia wexlerae]|nr:hypothetical protein M5E86_23325 [Blautia wexlerae]